MKSFLQLSEDKDQELNPVVMAFTKMNPPTSAHERLINKVKDGPAIP